MSTLRYGIALAGVVILAGCVPPPPPGPTIAAYPGQGKDYATFQRDDGFCRNEGERAINGVNPSAAATQNGVASAVIGTGLGAAAGALIGSASGHAGAGAAIGAGGGLLVGSAYGADNAAYTGNAIQHHYNMAYAQCMIGHGEMVQGMRRRAPPYYGGGGYGAPGPGYGGPGYGGPGYGGPGYGQGYNGPDQGPPPGDGGPNGPGYYPPPGPGPDGQPGSPPPGY